MLILQALQARRKLLMPLLELGEQFIKIGRRSRFREYLFAKTSDVCF
jgi:hypothetical protein